jgi:hypothetical protein
MTPIFNGVADSGSLAGVDFYRVDIDHAQDVVQHVGGQTVCALAFSEIHTPAPLSPLPLRACTRRAVLYRLMRW